MIWVFLRITRIIFWMVKVHLWIIYGDSWTLLIVCISIGSQIGWILMWGFLSWPVGQLSVGFAVISWIGWWASMREGSSMWGVMVRAVCRSVRMLSACTTSVRTPIVPVVWPRMSSEGVMVTLAVVPSMVWLWSRLTSSIPICRTVVWGWAVMMSVLGLWSLMMCRCTWGWYSVWTIHNYVSIFITLETAYIWAMTCYVAWFLALKTVILFMRHDIHCEGWYQCGCKLLCGIELLNFRDGINQSLWSLLVNVGS